MSQGQRGVGGVSGRLVRRWGLCARRWSRSREALGRLVRRRSRCRGPWTRCCRPDALERGRPGCPRAGGRWRGSPPLSFLPSSPPPLSSLPPLSLSLPSSSPPCAARKQKFGGVSGQRLEVSEGRRGPRAGASGRLVRRRGRCRRPMRRRGCRGCPGRASLTLPGALALALSPLLPPSEPAPWPHREVAVPPRQKGRAVPSQSLARRGR